MTPKPYASDLAKVRQLIVQPQVNFSAIQYAFLEIRPKCSDFGRDAERLDALPDELKTMVENALQQRGWEFRRLTSATFLHHHQESLIEGVAAYGSMACVMSLIYFTDLKTGLLTFSRAANDEVEFIRISQRPVAVARGLSGLN